MDPRAGIWREIMGLEDELRGPLASMERKAKKRRLATLRAQYGYPRTSDSTWHPGDEM